MKKILAFNCLLCVLSLNVFAVGKNVFYVYGSDNSTVSKTLGMTEHELKEYIEQTNITYLAVNKDNTKQIKKCEYTDDFSKKVQSFLSLKDAEILELAEQLSGIPDVTGQIVEKGALKYLKVTAKTKDSGGEYILTQYITVDKGVKINLSFYTDIDQGTDYIEEYFNSQFKETPLAFKVVTVIGIALFSLLAVIVLIAIIKDTFWKKA